MDGEGRGGVENGDEGGGGAADGKEGGAEILEREREGIKHTPLLAKISPSHTF